MAIDNLISLRAMIRDWDGLPPYTISSILRGAQEAACQLIWLLYPKGSDVRAIRLRSISNEETRQYRGYVTAVHRHAKTDALRAEMQEVLLNLSSEITDDAPRPSMTKIVRDVEDYMKRNAITPLDFPIEGFWRLHSSALHGRTWGWGTVVDLSDEVDDNGLCSLRIYSGMPVVTIVILELLNEARALLLQRTADAST